LSLPEPPAGSPDGPVFAEPWQAGAFALVVALHEKGLFTWPEWAAALSDSIAAGRDADEYYAQWLDALERILAAKGVAEPETLKAIAESWRRAAEATPHGQPILLGNDPRRAFRG
jgi:nitrile hydratase accessory protein